MLDHSLQATVIFLNNQKQKAIFRTNQERENILIELKYS